MILHAYACMFIHENGITMSCVGSLFSHSFSAIYSLSLFELLQVYLSVCAVCIYVLVS